MKNTLISKYGAKPSLCLLSLLLVFIVGCTTPNVKPFAESTETIVTGFKIGSAKAVTSLRLAGRINEAASLENDLKVRYELLDALLMFSVELAQIQSDSDRSKESVRQISEATNQLAMSLGAGISAPLTALATKLADEALEIREFHLISEAIEEIDPLVEEIANLAANFQSIRNIYIDSMVDVYNKKENEAEDTLDEDLEERIESLQDNITGDSPDPNMVSLFTAIYPVWKDQQQKIKSLLEESSTIRAEVKMGDAFYTSVKAAIVAWFEAYKDLASAFEENRQVNFIELYIRVQEIKTLMDAL